MLTVTEKKIIIPTYPEPPKEELPMFAENRVHQRTSGNPYPERVVVKVDRSGKYDREYRCVCLENDYLRIEILPELGGRIYSAFDKTTGYDFFYKQHVIKPALIGCLGSWISGGCEFNWPFHHRPSTFMPVDCEIERGDGEITVWLSENDPMERMKGMVGVSLRDGEAVFETKARLVNRTPLASSFLWWENTAVPVNEDYRIFFPPDVSYVNFHYKRSVTTYPVASNALGVFNGIRYERDTDISRHKNTRQPTSYFSAPSKYDFFGGYDEGKRCGVVHIADHHISPGKKMFTWAYNQLSRSWERALTDEDGQYAELMAGVYSDNQPDFSWIEPYETKAFSQRWFPIGDMGVPVFANRFGALHWEAGRVAVQLTRREMVRIFAEKEGKRLELGAAELIPGVPAGFDCPIHGAGARVTVISGDGRVLMDYTERPAKPYGIPETTKDMPNVKESRSAQELYLEGVHVWQYRDPAVQPDAYWREALLRDPGHIDSLLALGEFNCRRFDYQAALGYLDRAAKELTRFNAHPQSGKLRYLRALALLGSGEVDGAYDEFYSASWNLDYYSASMAQIAAIDGRRGDFERMEEHSGRALEYNVNNPLAALCRAAALRGLGRGGEAVSCAVSFLAKNPLSLSVQYLLKLMKGGIAKEFLEEIHTDRVQTALDIAFELRSCGLCNEARELLCAAPKSPVICYLLGEFETAERLTLATAFPSRAEEYRLLERVTTEHPELAMAQYYFACLLYAKGQFERAAAGFERCMELKPDFYAAFRNLAAACYTHLDRREEALPLLDRALELCPGSKQLIFEKAYVMAKLGCPARERIDFLEKHIANAGRDDIFIELARAYNQAGEYDRALGLMLDHAFVPCEGGEHAVAEQYMFALHAKGRRLMLAGDHAGALECFTRLQTLPESLGAGLWNECRLVPHQYYQALCLEKLGKDGEAGEIYAHILELKIDYFSNMHLPELPYYQAEAHRRLGDHLAARALMDEYSRRCEEAVGKQDAGYFSTTPFFISYCDEPKRQRRAYYSAQLGFAARFAGDSGRERAWFEEAAAADCSNMWYQLESELANQL